MIGYLKGTIIELAQRSCLLNVHDVGYELLVHDRITGLSGEQLELYVYTHVREDILQLFGFASRDEKKIFELLLSVNGIGPKSALEIMSQNMGVVIDALMAEDITTLTKIPGIGKKTAERMIIDLRGKTEQFIMMGSQGDTRVSTSQRSSVLEKNYGDVIQALEALGYDRKSIVIGLQSMNAGTGPQEHDTEEVLIKYCLQHI